MKLKHFFCRSVLFCTVALAVFSCAQLSSAEPITTPTITGSVVGGAGPGFSYSPGAGDVQLAEDGKTWELIAPMTCNGEMGGCADITIKELIFDPDPIIYGNMLLMNTSGGDQTYSLTYSLPTTWAGPLQIRGSIDTSVIGPNASVAAPVGGSVYNALIDGSSVRTLQDAPFTLSTPQDAESSSTNFTWEATGTAAVTSDIGIQLTFTLSPGATATIISDFEVIPEPASMTMIGLVSSIGLFIRRRFIA